MPRVDEYQNGTPSWVDLAATDLTGAREFYSGLFGWDFVDEQMEEMGIGTYSMAMIDDVPAAAIYELGPEQLRPADGPGWNVYVTVDDIEGTLGKARSGGGAVLAGVTEVGGAGRAAVIEDPTGCVTTLWEPGEFAGSGVRAEVGAFTWPEHLSTDSERSVRFYKQVFGVETETQPDIEVEEYTVLVVGGIGVGGVMQMPDEMIAEGVKSEWYVYFQVGDFDDSAEYVRNHGGRLMAEPLDVPDVGRIVVMRDPQGADFCIVEPLRGTN